MSSVHCSTEGNYCQLPVQHFVREHAVQCNCVFIMQANVRKKCHRTCRCKFQILFSGVSVPSKSTIHLLANKCRKKYSLLKTKESEPDVLFKKKYYLIAYLLLSHDSDYKQRHFLTVASHFNFQHKCDVLR